ncbi:DUF5134 domain-containing protein [Streptomyces montanus]|uniref:DUF5134 domain-containing protein n=1 Tax=Streptomyces montanus TaxID=2580423 RepID=A0A5R9FWL4_9ACTN|nr:DUF5134 domain-containing protein [Streptomyces montanus]TLS47871.1 DUF5134 domain-containing protein [Streptomyces montanus]
MHGATSQGWLLVALCAATGTYCLLRMRSPVEEQRRTAGGEALMGFGMAAMAVPAAALTPPRWAWLGYTAVFGAAALRALWAARTGPHHLHHLVGASAMVYMAAAMARGAHSGVPVLTGVLLVYFTAYVLWTGTRLVPVAVAGHERGGARPARWGDRPELSRACRLSMGIGMLAMLLTL